MLLEVRVAITFREAAGSGRAPGGALGVLVIMEDGSLYKEFVAAYLTFAYFFLKLF